MAFPLRAITATTLALTLAACSGGEPAAAPSATTTTAVTTPAAPPSPQSARPQFQTDWEACSALVGALPPAGEFNPTLLTAIGKAATTSANQSVRFGGQFLIDTVELAVAAKTNSLGASAEASTYAAAIKAGTDLLAACRRAKLVT